MVIKATGKDLQPGDRIVRLFGKNKDRSERGRIVSVDGSYINYISNNGEQQRAHHSVVSYLPIPSEIRRKMRHFREINPINNSVLDYGQGRHHAFNRELPEKEPVIHEVSVLDLPGIEFAEHES